MLKALVIGLWNIKQREYLITSSYQIQNTTKKVAESQINSSKESMIETGHFEVSDLYKNCLVKQGVWNLMAHAQKERRFLIKINLFRELVTIIDLVNICLNIPF
ncbi:hypothetical protein BpHYR1_029195 [Brachionus plicatilis]|uniref:Uncharacterized protein n=1 Tax=Brachionus plicatilis TaxID=10195 RepID=A0A3M7Q5E7_BRAPC|nr:hypothetical protein BpHYR1_029195 [Brachionus plicatilis]